MPLSLHAAIHTNIPSLPSPLLSSPAPAPSAWWPPGSWPSIAPGPGALEDRASRGGWGVCVAEAALKKDTDGPLEACVLLMRLCFKLSTISLGTSKRLLSVAILCRHAREGIITLGCNVFYTCIYTYINMSLLSFTCMYVHCKKSAFKNKKKK